VIVAGQHTAAAVLWFLGLLLWAVIMYTFFTAVTVGESKPSMETGISGTWLLAFLMPIPRVFIFVALAAWLITFTGLIHSLPVKRSRN
jgi:hypothetical protein